VLLTTHPLLAPRSRKRRAVPLPTLWVTTGPVMGLLYLFSIIPPVVYTHSCIYHQCCIIFAIAAL